MNEIVECLSGFTYADRPVALTWEGRRLEILNIQAEWRTPNENHFRVRSAGELEFDLVYDHLKDEWQITPIQEI